MKDKTRRYFLKAGAAAAVGSTLAAPNIAQAKGKRFKWKMCTTWSPKLPILQESSELFAKMVAKATDGRLKIKVFAGGELIPPLEVFDAAQNGSIEMGAGASYYWQGKVTASPFFSALPFGLNAHLQNIWLQAGGGIELWRELYAPQGLVPFVFGNTGAQMAGWYKKEINSFADLKGLKIRIPGLGGKVMARAGANVVLMPGAELYTALERGTIDATEWVNPFHDERLGLYRAAKFYYYPGWQEPGTTLELIINKAKWSSLPKDIQEIVASCVEYINSWVLNKSEAANGPALDRLTKDHRVQLKELPADVLIKLREISEEVVNEIADSDTFSKKVLDSYRAFQKQAANWNAISEVAYYSKIRS